jgi:hypothetical protein
MTETPEQFYDRLREEGESDYSTRKIISEMEIFSNNLKSMFVEDMKQILSQYDSNPDSIESAESVVGKALDYLTRL